MPTLPKISTREAAEALVRSGYLLESRLEQLLVSRGFYVQASDAYPDPSTGKSRELDLYALTAERIGPNRGFAFNVLLIECLNDPQPLVLITKKPQTGFLFHEDLRVAGLPVKLLSGGRRGTRAPIANALRLEQFHHYCAGRVATQFCSFSKKSQGEWFAQHETPHFDAFSKLCDAVDHFQDKHFRSWKFGPKEVPNLEFYYPVVVAQGELLDARPKKGTVRLVPLKRGQFRRISAHGLNPKTYQIDVVQEKAFPRYLILLERELHEIVQRLTARRRLVTDSIVKIVANARRFRSTDKIREAMEATRL